MKLVNKTHAKERRKIGTVHKLSTRVPWRCERWAKIGTVQKLKHMGSLATATRRLWVQGSDILVKAASCYGVGWRYGNLGVVSILACFVNLRLVEGKRYLRL